MIQVDHRTGSRELLRSIRSYGVDAELATNLDADFVWSGNAPDGPALILVERKVIADLLTSLRERRLDGFQIGNMLDITPYTYLVIEGSYRANYDGFVEIATVKPLEANKELLIWRVAHGSHTWSSVQKQLESIAQLTGTRIIQTRDDQETAQWLAACHDWWQKSWDEHHTGSKLYTPRPTRGRQTASGLWRGKQASLTERWLHALPGLDSKALKLAPYFPLPEHIVTEHHWDRYDGIGRTGARRIMEAIHGSQTD